MITDTSPGRGGELPHVGFSLASITGQLENNGEAIHRILECRDAEGSLTATQKEQLTLRQEKTSILVVGLLQIRLTGEVRRIHVVLHQYPGESITAISRNRLDVSYPSRGRDHFVSTTSSSLDALARVEGTDSARVLQSLVQKPDAIVQEAPVDFLKRTYYEIREVDRRIAAAVEKGQPPDLITRYEEFKARVAMRYLRARRRPGIDVKVIKDGEVSQILFSQGGDDFPIALLPLSSYSQEVSELLESTIEAGGGYDPVATPLTNS